MVMADTKQEQVDEAVMSAAEVEMPYSIYTSKEKWLIVGIVGLAGLYRYIQLTSSQLTLYTNANDDAVHYQPTSTSPPSQPSPPHSAKASTR
jgi:hypothetical protein